MYSYISCAVGLLLYGDRNSESDIGLSQASHMAPTSLTTNFQANIPQFSASRATIAIGPLRACAPSSLPFGHPKSDRSFEAGFSRLALASSFEGKYKRDNKATRHLSHDIPLSVLMVELLQEGLKPSRYNTVYITTKHSRLQKASALSFEKKLFSLSTRLP